MTQLSWKDPIRQAAEAHTNLSVFAAVVHILEGGSIYGDQPEAAQIIRIAQRAQARLLRKYDKAAAEAAAMHSTP